MSPTQVTATVPSDSARRSPWYRSAAPQRPGIRVLALSTATAVAGLAALVATGSLLDSTLMIPPLAASMALVAGAPHMPLAQPRNVIGGQLVAALTGFGVLAVLGEGMWSAAIAGGLALGAMLGCRVSHSPAAATAVIVVLSEPPLWQFLALLAMATVILVVVGVVGARTQRKPYPVYWW